jgi:putative nucleotidyltransferase with HDIG domain
MTKLKLADSPKKPCALSLMRALEGHRQCKRGVLVYALALLFLSLFAGFNFEPGHKLYVQGQVAGSDVVADRFLLVEDRTATDARRKQVMLLQPPVYDLSMEPYIVFEQRLIDLMRELNGVPVKGGREAPSELFSAEIGPELAREILPELGLSSTQAFVLKKLLPLLRARLSEGLVGDIRTSRVGRSGVVVRNLDTGAEVLRPDVATLPDMQSFLAEVSTVARGEEELTHNARRAINVVLATCLPATLTLNREATQKRAAEVVDKVEPVYYQIQKGELILRRGERVGREQQIKIQALYRSSEAPLDWQRSLGSFLLASFLSLGFFLSPSGRPGTPISNKDLYLVSIITVVTTLCAKGVHALGGAVGSTALADAFTVAFPMAGAVGFVAMVFAAKRYVTMGLLLTLFTALAMRLGAAFCFFHFLSAMLATWLVVTSVSRQDTVWNLIPLILGECLLVLGASFVDNLSLSELPMLLTATCINSLLTLILFFSLSPVLETVFGYSTRFKLMEFISLEQPLMQELMVTVPGTYHHSIVVANMVEAGAKAIGANSLLCKVAALYHDAGKIFYPQYFIENQFGGENRHDKLAPSMSALIITSHVKKGMELCGRYRLGKEITDIIAQHHGTRVVRFFYQKAVKLGEDPSESDYSYPGPKPQTKEAAILMLADSVEASSRTLSDPTPARLTAHIDKIIKGIFAEGQLDESELTFKDLHLLGESFRRVLTGIFHQRIAYPEPVRKVAERPQPGQAASPEAGHAAVGSLPESAQAKPAPLDASAMPQPYAGRAEDAVRQARAAYQAQARAMAAATRGLAPSAAVQAAPVQAAAVQAAGGQACQPGQNPAQADAGQDLLDGGPLTLGEPVAETGEDWQAASAGLADLVEQAFRTSQPGADKAPEQGGAKHG